MGETHYLETLTPITLDAAAREQLVYEDYEKALDMAFSQDEIRNIALSGPYGAGKSTIMQTYEDDHRDKKCIHISLAKFDIDKAENTPGNTPGNSEDEVNQRDLEIKILNQLIHQIEPQLVPQTQFRIKQKISGLMVLVYTLVITALFFSALYLVKVPASRMLAKSKETLFESFIAYPLNIAMLVVLVASAFFLILRIVNRQLKKPLIKSIQVDKSQIDLVEEEKEKNEHQFDRYMDEIIYLFREGKVDALVLEDLDRLGQMKLFVELREMNFLINRKCAKQKKGFKNKQKKTVSIKFIYMVKDDLFEDYEQRTKFFDLMIPIVPVMDSSNSFDLLKKMMEQEKGKAWVVMLDMDYLKTICLYIKDYRILKNIYNEYRIYFRHLKVEQHGLDATKLFAMITYKNLWPVDYGKLLRGDGYVYEKFQELGEKRKELQAKYETEIAELEARNHALEQAAEQSIDELDAVYFNKIPENYTYDGVYVVDGKNEHDFSNRVEFIQALKKAQNVQIRRAGGSGVSPVYDADEIAEHMKEILSAPEYQKKKQCILACEAGEKEQNLEKIQKLRRKKEQAENWNLQEYLHHQSGEQGEKQTEKELVDIFLKDGMIAEDYALYTTYFYPYSLTAEELRYLNHVHAGKPGEGLAQLRLAHPEVVEEHLKKKDYDSPALWNVDLLEYFLSRGKRAEVVRMILNMQKYQGTDAALDYYLHGKCKEEWLAALVGEWEGVVTSFLKKDILTREQKEELVIAVMSAADKKEVALQLESETCRMFWKQNEAEILQRCSLELLEKCTSIIKVMALETAALDETKWNYIYSHDMYEWSVENVNYILVRAYQLEQTDAFFEENYQTICSQEGQQLQHRVLTELPQYLEQVYLPQLAEESKEEQQMVFFLNQSVDIALKQSLIEKMSLRIQELKQIEDARLWEMLIQQNKCAFTWRNVLIYWAETDKLSEELEAFLKENYKNNKCGLTFNRMKDFLGETDKEHPRTNGLMRQLIGIKNMGNAYENMLSEFNAGYSSFPWEIVEISQVRALVEKKNIHMSEVNLQHMRGLEDKKLCYHWIVMQFDQYLKLMKNEKLRDSDELGALLSAEELDDKKKIELVVLYGEPVRILDTYNSALVETILDQNLFGGGYSAMIRRYSAGRYSKKLEKKIMEFLTATVTDLAEEKFAIPNAILMQLCTNSSITRADKKTLVAGQIMYHTLEEVKGYLETIGASDYLKVWKGQKPKIEATQADRQIIAALIRQGWISSYKAEDDFYVLQPKRRYMIRKGEPLRQGK